MNKKELLDKIKQLEGLNSDEKAYLLNLVNTRKKYGLVWEDKPEDVEEELRTKLPVLREVKDKAIVNGDDYPNHILIEGDNLHALTALTFTHEEAIDLIYIDPPYNTGENDFKYNDTFVDKEDSFRHSKWLSFVSKRFQIMKRLLSDTGVALIHIDENEFDALSILLETEVFSEKDCLGYIVWNKKNPKGDAKEVATMHEYVFCFAKNIDEFKKLENSLKRKKPNALEIIQKAKTLFRKIGIKTVPEEIKEVVKPFNFPKEKLKDFEVLYDLKLINKEFQNWLDRQSNFSEGEKAYKFIDEKGEVFQSVSMSWPNKDEAPDDYFLPLNHPINGAPCPVPNRGWRNPSSTMLKLLGEKEPIELFDNTIIKGEIIFTINKNGENNQPRRKYLLKENLLENTPSIFNFGGSDDVFFNSIGLNFPYAKPVEVAKYFLSSIHPNPKIVLDFFAGSGTTLHAVLELNDDGKDITGIIVTNNEVDLKTEQKLVRSKIQKGSEEYEKEGVCRKITYPRLSKLICGYNTVQGNSIPGLSLNNLRYFQCDFVERKPTLFNKRKLTRLATELLCIKEDTYKEVTSLLGNAAWHRLFTDGKGKHVYIVYDDLYIDDAVELLEEFISKHQPKAKVKVYVFSNGQYAYTEEFESLAEKVELAALPDAIYKALAQVLPKENREDVPELEDEVSESEAAN